MPSSMNRRSFIKNSTAAGMAISMAPAILQGKDDRRVKLGFIGVGGRGTGLLKTCLRLPEVDIPAVSDLLEKNIRQAQDLVEQSGRQRPEGYSRNETSYLDMLNRDDLQGVVIATPWEMHIPMAIDTMKAGKYTAHEVGPANSIDECWEYVKTYEETGMPCMYLENYCYFRYTMAVLNMVRQGIFGELIHTECAYCHELQKRLVMGKGTGITLEGGGDYMTFHYKMRNGDLYPSHGVGPIAQCLNILRGNRFTYLTSMGTKARGLHHWILENLGEDHPYADIEWKQDDIVSTMIKCQNGENVIVNFDMSLPRPTTGRYLIQGTKGIWMQDGDAFSRDKSTIYLEGRSPHHQWESFDSYQEEYEHPLWKNYLKGETYEGHGGTDFLELRAFAESIKRKTEPPIDVYDGATWMAISPLSEASVAMGSMPVEFPDFTNGKWMTNKPIFGLTDEY